MGIKISFRFSSPIGESIFSTFTEKGIQRCQGSVLVPYRGIYFLYQDNTSDSENKCLTFSSPIGESIFSTRKLRTVTSAGKNSSRPLSGNLFSLPLLKYSEEDMNTVLVPYRGIYFLYKNNNNLNFRICVLVPYRGIYFLYRYSRFRYSKSI